MDASVSPVFGEQEGAAYNAHFSCTCYHPIFLFNQFGDLERCALRPGHVASADDRFQLNALAYNMLNFLGTLALPAEIATWSLTSLREKVVKIGAKDIAHARYTVSQMAEVAVPQDLFRGILEMIDDLRCPRVARC